MLKVLFFSALRDQLKTAELSWPANATTVAELRQQLQQQGEPWATALARPDLLCARNQAFCSLNETICSGDEIAFFPPVTGG